jgi:GTP-binding protein LepA
MELCKAHRGEYLSMDQSSPRITIINFVNPLSEIIIDFFDKLKSVTQGYASMDYNFVGFRKADLVKLDILVNKSPVDALSIICFRQDAQRRGRVLVERLRSVIHRQQYEVAIQAALGGRIIASEKVKPVRKDVTGKCYGGDVTRKRKLLEKQKKGKKRMKSLGSIEIPEEAFREILKK